MDVYQAILSLRAVRHFTDQPLSDDVIKRILQAARWTGSSNNEQSWQFVVVRQRSMLENLAACTYTSHLGRAAMGIIIATPSGSGLFDVGRVAQNMMLAAWGDGVGSCIASFRDAAAACSLLGIPDSFQAAIAISFGYPQEDAPHTIEGRPMKEVLARVGRRPLRELVHWEKW